MEINMDTNLSGESKEVTKNCKSTRNYSIEFLRFFFAIGVVFGHCYCIFYMNDSPSYSFFFHNACVDFFFVISGYFMACHFEARKAEDKYRTYVDYNLLRIVRLWPLLFVSALEGIIFELAFNLLSRGKFYFSTNIWGGFFFLGGLNNFDAVNVIWYISALFWCELLLSSFLCFNRKIAICCCFPLLAFCSLSIMNMWNCSNLYSIPLVFNWLSTGLIRGICGLIFGIESFYIALFAKDKLYIFSKKAITLFSVLIEIGFILLVCYLIFKQHMNNKEFLMFFFTAALLIVFNLNTQKIFSIFNKKFFEFFGRISVWIYVLHFYILKTMFYIPKFRLLPPPVVYSSVIATSIFISIFAYYIISKITAGIKRFCLANY